MFNTDVKQDSINPIPNIILYLAISSFKSIFVFSLILLINFNDAFMLHTDRINIIIVFSISPGKMHENAPKMPLNLYVFMIDVIVNDNVNVFKKAKKIINGIPIIDIPKTYNKIMFISVKRIEFFKISREFAFLIILRSNIFLISFVTNSRSILFNVKKYIIPMMNPKSMIVIITVLVLLFGMILFITLVNVLSILLSPD